MIKTEILNGEIGIEKASKLLQENKVVAIPTETVYGLAANAFSVEAISKIFEIKNRPMDNPLIVHTHSIDEIKNIAKEIGPNAKKIIQHFMPGPLTIVLKKLDSIPKEVTASLDNVAIRIPENPIAREIIKRSKLPLAAPSANLSTKISPTSANDVFNDLNGKIELIVDGGQCSVGIESTVLDMSDDKPIILRPGIITKSMINDVINGVENFKGEIKNVPSPGMKYKHYAPIVETVVVQSSESVKKIISQNKNKKLTLISTDIFAKNINDINLITFKNNDLEIAKNIYKALHQAEKVSDLIMVEYFKGTEIKESVMNRIIKAAGNIII